MDRTRTEIQEGRDAAYFEAILMAMPNSLIAIDGEEVIQWRNRPAAETVPGAEPGRPVREFMAEWTDQSRIELLLDRREMVAFRTREGGPEMEWLNSPVGLPGGGRLLIAWDAGWTDSLTQRRIAFTMAASHELRTPLTALIGFTEILAMQKDEMTPAQAEAVEMLERTTAHLRSLVDDIFDLTRNSFGMLKIAVEDTRLDAVAVETVASMANLADSRGQSIDIRSEEGLPPVPADPSRVRQMISNLIDNASTHNPAGTAIRVDVFRGVGQLGREGVFVSVTDDGEGLPFDDPEEAFDSFRRGAPETEPGRSGSGMGLAVTRQLMKLHRGRIEAETARGAGTRITLGFPLDRSRPLADDPKGGTVRPRWS